MRRLCSLAALALSSLLTASAQAQVDELEVNLVDVPAPGAESVVIEHPLGKLILRGWDKPRVHIVSIKHAANGIDLRRLRVSYEMKDGKIEIRTGVRVGGEWRSLPVQGAGIDLTVDAPQQVTLKASTWSGDLDVAGFRAGAELASAGGEVRASDIDGPVRTHAEQGRQVLSVIRGDVEANGVTGDLEIDHVDGEVLAARVVDGQITARAIHTPVIRLFSMAGPIVLFGELRPGGRYELTALDGDVRLVLARAAFSVRARSAGGVVKSAFHVSGESTPTRLRGNFLGGGPSIELTAAHGNISLEEPESR